jgi:hypothetical protein
MSSATLHSAFTEQPRSRRVRPDGPRSIRATPLGPLLSTPDILPKMPAEALSPALFELLNLMSGPVLLIEDGTAGEPRRRAPARTALPAPA